MLPSQVIDLANRLAADGFARAVLDGETDDDATFDRAYERALSRAQRAQGIVERVAPGLAASLDLEQPERLAARSLLGPPVNRDRVAGEADGDTGFVQVRGEGPAVAVLRPAQPTGEAERQLLMVSHGAPGEEQLRHPCGPR